MNKYLLFLLCTVALLISSCSSKVNNSEGTSGQNNNANGNSTDSKVVFVLFDLSASTAAQETRQKYADSFKRVLGKVGANDIIVADTITDNPLSQSNFPVNKTFPTFEPGTDNDLLVKKKREDFNSQLQQQRDQINSQVSSLLNDQTRKIKSTKILDAIQLADRVFHTYNRPKKVLVIFSDMIEESEHYNFQRQKLTDAETQRIIETEKKAGRIPDLSSVRVYVVGSSSGNKSSSDTFYNIENFWLQYFKAANADLSKEHYGAALLNFEE